MTTIKKTIELLTLFFLVAIYSCSQEQELKRSAADTVIEKSENIDKPESAGDNSEFERKIIKEGEITFETGNSNETRALISKVVSEVKGYISKDNVFDHKDKIEHRITIRVPFDKFELLLDRISENVKKLDSKNINTLDITEEFIDIEARIKTKKELENRYKDLLKQANKVEEILTIEKEFGSLRTEIESIEGRLNYLSDRVSYSTLTVIFYERTSSSFRFTSKFGQALDSGWSNLLWFFIALTNLWPFILIGLTIIIMIRRLNKRNKKKNAS